MSTTARSTMRPDESSSADPRPRGKLGDYDGLIIDLDGVVWLEGHAIEGAPEAIAQLRSRGIAVIFLTNDPVSSPEAQAAQLTKIGIPAEPGEVMTSAAATARFIATTAGLRGRPALVIGSRALRAEIADAGLVLLGHGEAAKAEVVVVGGHRGFDYEELRAATTAVLAGAELFATGRDPVVPTGQGPMPATGAIVAAIETATGHAATVIGKPEPFVFELAREALAACEHVAVIGDNLVSDITGAKRAGLDAMLVLTGSTTEEDARLSDIRPDLVAPSLATLVES
jgi:HAD superfamily hydrolase (TIGR01450 family)